MDLTAILITAVLIAANGLFVAAEFAIVGAPKASIDRLARQGNPIAKHVRAILDNPRRQDRMIATAQLGITLASLGLGMYGEHKLAVWLASVFEALGAGRWIAAHTLASILAVGTLTYFHIVVGEMVPKSIALQRAQRTVLWILPVMVAIQFALYPLVVLLNGIGNLSLRLLGVRRDTHTREHYRTPEELAYLVRETMAGGLLRRESGSVVQQVFEFGGLTADEVMVPRVRITGLPLGADRDTIHAVLTSNPHTRYPVYTGTMDSIVGAVHVKDLMRCLATNSVLAADSVRTVPFVPGTAQLDGVLAAMNTVRSQLVVVMDEFGGTAGIVTTEDLFEEVVGELSEDPASQQALKPGPDGAVTAAGTVRLAELGAALGVSLDHESVNTAGGLVLALLGRPARVGESVTHGGVRLEVLDTDGNSVRRVVASKAR